jgi:nucleoside permease NupC
MDYKGRLPILVLGMALFIGSIVVAFFNMGVALGMLLIGYAINGIDNLIVKNVFGWIKRKINGGSK